MGTLVGFIAYPSPVAQIGHTIEAAAREAEARSGTLLLRWGGEAAVSGPLPRPRSDAAARSWTTYLPPPERGLVSVAFRPSMKLAMPAFDCERHGH